MHKTTYRLGIDVGGTDTKFGIVDDCGNIVFKEKRPTCKESTESFVSNLVSEYERISKEYPIGFVGIGVPGTVIDDVVDASNVPLPNVNLKEMLEGRIKVPFKIENDANCAALGEALVGSGKNVKNMIMITLGTGIGGGIVIDNKIYHGRGGAGEVGHICIEVNGRQCACGFKGCWEQYGSAKALTTKAEQEAVKNKDSILYEYYTKNGNKIGGTAFFEALNDNCPVAKSVFEEYIDYLVAGLVSVAFVFDPDMIVLSGGITNVGDQLIKPVAKKFGLGIPITISTLKSDAGIVGSALQ